MKNSAYNYYLGESVGDDLEESCCADSFHWAIIIATTRRTSKPLIVPLDYCSAACGITELDSLGGQVQCQ